MNRIDPRHEFLLIKTYDVDHHDEIAHVASCGHCNHLPETFVGFEEFLQVRFQVGICDHKHQATVYSSPDVDALIQNKRYVRLDIEL